MPKYLEYAASTGHVIISNVEPSSISDIYASLSDIYFHSALGYLQGAVVTTYTATHAFQSRNNDDDKFGGDHYSPRTGAADILLGTHNYGTAPLFIAAIGDTQVPAGTVVQQVGQSYRVVSVYVTASEVRAYEQYVTYDDSLPQVDISYKVVLFTKATVAVTTDALLISPTKVALGYGKFDTDYRYVRKSVNSDMFITPYKGADVAGGGLKLVYPNGAVYQDSSYTGVFTGTAGTGVKV